MKKVIISLVVWGFLVGLAYGQPGMSEGPGFGNWTDNQRQQVREQQQFNQWMQRQQNLESQRRIERQNQQIMRNQKELYEQQLYDQVDRDINRIYGK